MPRLNRKRILPGLAVAGMVLMAGLPAMADTQKVIEGVVYTYDIEERIIEIAYPDGTKLIYTYNSDGTRSETIVTPETGE